MASTYSNLKIQLMTTGENDTTWGAVTNTNLGTAIEEAIAGSTDVTFSSNNITLTLTNTNASQPARHMRLNLVGTTGGSTRELVVPGIEKMYVVTNGCSDAITVKVSGQTGVTVPAGKSMLLFNDGVDVQDALVGISVNSGGTGRNSITANAVVLGNGTSAVQTVAPGTSGNVLTSNGTTWGSIAPPASFVAGMIMLWSGSIATVPTGWQLCDGTNGTPDLRDRFVVGAGTSYAVNATGGSKDAIVVAHTHTYSGTTANAGSHTHSFSTNLVLGTCSDGGSGIISGGCPAGGVSIQSAGDHAHTFSGTTASTGSSATNANLPPYYALAYIMKL